jgi:hypothetical protein
MLHSSFYYEFEFEKIRDAGLCYEYSLQTDTFEIYDMRNWEECSNIFIKYSMNIKRCIKVHKGK